MLDSSVQIVTELPRLAPRRPESHKGNYGRILVIAGSRGMAGAGVLCASAALRAGAGLVKLAVPHELLPLVAVANPCVMTTALPQDDDGRFAAEALTETLQLAAAHDVVAVGPGLGRSPGLAHVVKRLLAEHAGPIVLDADGLNNLADDVSALSRRAGPLVITPHPGEFGRLLKSDTIAVHANRRELVAAFARTHGLIVVLKGDQTLVCDGHRLFVNTTGNPGMATAGSGDVLTGVIAALIGQNLDAFAAAQLGVHLHGLAGDLAAAKLGQISVIATDLIDDLPCAFQQYDHGLA